MKKFTFFILIIAVILLLFSCRKAEKEKEMKLSELENNTSLQAEYISYEKIIKGIGPPDYLTRTGAEYKPSKNEDPAIPAQCWIETSYGTQNACKYCHTNFLADIQHGNSQDGDR